jgi:hypothetical protein
MVHRVSAHLDPRCTFHLGDILQNWTFQQKRFNKTQENYLFTFRGRFVPSKTTVSTGIAIAMVRHKETGPTSFTEGKSSFKFLFFDSIYAENPFSLFLDF